MQWFAPLLLFIPTITLSLSHVPFFCRRLPHPCPLHTSSSCCTTQGQTTTILITRKLHVLSKKVFVHSSPKMATLDNHDRRISSLNKAPLLNRRVRKKYRNGITTKAPKKFMQQGKKRLKKVMAKKRVKAKTLKTNSNWKSEYKKRKENHTRKSLIRNSNTNICKIIKCQGKNHKVLEMKNDQSYLGDVNAQSKLKKKTNKDRSDNVHVFSKSKQGILKPKLEEIKHLSKNESGKTQSKTKIKDINQQNNAIKHLIKQFTAKKGSTKKGSADSDPINTKPIPKKVTMVSQSASISTAESRVIKHRIRQQEDKTKSSRISHRNIFSKKLFHDVPGVKTVAPSYQPYPHIIQPLGRAFTVQQLMDRINNPGLDERHQDIHEEIIGTTISPYKEKLREKKTKERFHPVSLRSRSNMTKGLSPVFVPETSTQNVVRTASLKEDKMQKIKEESSSQYYIEMQTSTESFLSEAKTLRFQSSLPKVNESDKNNQSKIIGPLLVPMPYEKSPMETTPRTQKPEVGPQAIKESHKSNSNWQQSKLVPNVQPRSFQSLVNIFLPFPPPYSLPGDILGLNQIIPRVAGACFRFDCLSAPGHLCCRAV